MFISSPQRQLSFSPPAVFHGIKSTQLGDPNFPTNLTDCSGLPERLFFRGSLQSSDSQAVAIVGSRACTEEGRDQAFGLASELGLEGLAIVSGLALGIDTAAHRGALSVGGRTIAVIGTGLNHVYPYENKQLSEQIAETGAMVSQFDPCFTGHRGGRNFKKRNALIVGLSQLVVVVEAQLYSGTAHTIKEALAMGRKVGLCQSLINSQAWAAQLAEHEQVFAVRSAACVLERLGL